MWLWYDANVAERPHLRIDRFTGWRLPFKETSNDDILNDKKIKYWVIF